MRESSFPIGTVNAYFVGHSGLSAYLGNKRAVQRAMHGTPHVNYSRDFHEKTVSNGVILEGLRNLLSSCYYLEEPKIEKNQDHAIPVTASSLRSSKYRRCLCISKVFGQALYS